MQLGINVAGGLIKTSATVAGKYAGIVLVFAGAGLIYAGLAMLSNTN